MRFFATPLRGAPLRGARRADFGGDSGELAAVQAHPAWMVERWTSVYGAEAMRAICRHGQSQPRMTVRMESPAVQDELSEAGIELASGELLTAARTVVSGDVTATAAFREGRARVQDEGSQLIGELAAGIAADLVQDRKRQERFSMRARRPAARRSSSRNEVPMRRSSLANRVRGGLPNCASVSPRTPIAWSAGLPMRPNLKKMRHSILRWWMCHAAGPARWAAILKSVIVCSWKICRGLPNANGAFCARLCEPFVPAARVVYSTCSLEPEENEQVVAAILAENPKCPADFARAGHRDAATEWHSPA